MKSVLITGGCGFLGQHLVQKISKEFPKAKIKIIDLRDNPNNPPIKSKNIETITGINICDFNTIEKHFKGIEVIIHLAGIVSFSLKDKKLLYDVNINGTKNVIKAVKLHKIKKFIHISSVAALGYTDNKTELVDEDFKFNWKEAKLYKKYYMLSKHLADVEINKSKTNAIVLYPGLMLGPHDITNSAKLINAIKENKIPANMSGGTNIIDVRDVADGIILTLKKNLTKGEFLLSGHNLTFTQVNSTIASELKVEPPKKTIPRAIIKPMFWLLLLIESLSKKKLELTADNLHSASKLRYFDNSKAKKELGWKPKISFEKTIKDTILWMKKDGMLKE